MLMTHPAEIALPVSTAQIEDRVKQMIPTPKYVKRSIK